MFKVGDIITGTPDNTYYITNSEGTYQVVEIINSSPEEVYNINIKVMSHTIPDVIGGTYPVSFKFFKLCKPLTNEEKFSKFLKRVESRHVKV